jgi:hypothetical protein
MRRILAYVLTHPDCTTREVGEGVEHAPGRPIYYDQANSTLRRLAAKGLVTAAGRPATWRGDGTPAPDASICTL